MNTSRKRLVNARRALWKTQAKPKKIGQLTPCGDSRLGCAAKAKPGGGRSSFSVGEQKTKIKRDVTSCQKQMRPGPATRAAFVRGFLLCLSTAKRCNDRFSPTALERSAAFAKASCRFVTLRRTCDRYGGQRPCPAPRSKGGGGRNARATSRAYARFAGISPGNSPSRITGCRWLCRNHSAGSGTLTFR